MKIIERIDSTNKCLKDEIREQRAKAGDSVLAFFQTMGRGRLGRSFASPEGGIYMSLVLPLDDSMTLTSKAAVAVLRAIESVCHKKVSIKWVNDIYFEGKKVCGILAEAVGNLVVVGIGVNFCTRKEDIPQELREIATSLYDGENKAPDKVKFAKEIEKNLIELAECNDMDWLDDYRNNNMLLGKKVNIIQADVITGTGIVTSVDDSCALHVMTETGERILSTGEVSIRYAN